MTHAGGRPLLFETVKDLDDKIEAYFLKCEQEKKCPRITDMAVFLNTSRETLINYKERPEFFDSIKKALDLCGSAMEEKLITPGMGNTIGVIFTLKNNYGWKDKSEVEQTNVNINRHAKDMSDDELDKIIGK